MITCETYMRFDKRRNKVVIRFFNDGKSCGKISCKSFDEVSTLLGHYEKVFGCPVKFPEM